MRSALKATLFATALFWVVGAQAYNDTSAGGSINLGKDSLFTVLTSGDLNDTSNAVFGSSGIRGNVGIGGQGNFSMSADSSFINGNLYMNSYGTVTVPNPAKQLNKILYHQDSVLNNALADAQSLSDAAFAEAVTPAYASLTDVNLTSGQHMSITGGANQKIVLDLTNFTLSSGSWFTLKGTATTSFIINVTNTFSLTGASWISLSNVPPKNVLFNVVGTGSQVSLTGNSYMYGILLAKKRQVAVNGSWIRGRAIAEQLSLTNGGQICSQ